MTRAAATTLVEQFYGQALTVSPDTTPSDVLGRVLADDFVSVNGQESKTKAMLIQQVAGFWQLIPDLRWDVQEVLVDGDKVVVRSRASGTPKGNFMGKPSDGTRSFRIDTIDIHELREGRIARVYHVEDWATAMKQLFA
jgi:steroid delta-isomerase-like uncharacterized protein